MAHFRPHIGLVLLVIAAGCGSRNKTPDDAIVTVLPAPVSNLDPLMATDANTQHVNQLIHLSLTRIGPNLLPEPLLAESFRAIGDKTIEFRLRAGCRFQNGREVKAEDVEASVRLYSDPAHKSMFQQAFGKIERFEEVDARTFRLHTKDPAPALLYDLAVLKIMPPEEYDPEKFRTKPVGAGSYRVTELSARGVWLERFDNGCMPLPPMPRLQAKVVRDDLSRFLKLRSGEVDIALNELDLRKVKMIRDGKVKGLAATAADGTGYSYMGLNFANSHLKKQNVRRAIALAIDTDAMIRYKLVDMATPTSTLVSPSSFFHENVAPIKRDLAEARRLLDVEGYSNGQNGKPPLKLTLKTTTFRPVAENARAIAAQLAEAGIEVDHKAFEWGTFYGDVKARNTEMFLLRWVGTAAPDLLAEIFHTKRLQENNRTNYSNPKVDALLDEASTTLDPEKRKRAFASVQRIIADELPYISLWHNQNAVAYRDNIEGVELLPTGDWDVFLKMRKVARGKAE